MATDLSVSVRTAKYGGYVAEFDWNGEHCRILFASAVDLASELVEACVDQETLDSVMDSFERLEWSAPSAEIPADCDCRLCRGFPSRPSYVESVNARFYPWVLALLTLSVAWLAWRVNG